VALEGFDWMIYVNVAETYPVLLWGFCC